MPKNKLVEELLVSNFDESLHFYRDIVKFNVDFERPEDRLLTCLSMEANS